MADALFPFERALEALRRGRRVARAAWGAPGYGETLLLEDGRLVQLDVLGVRIPVDAVKASDLLAGDWLVIP